MRVFEMNTNRFNRMCIGLIVTWRDVEPFGDTKPYDCAVSASTPAKRVLADSFYRMNSAKILNSDLRWLIEVSICFLTPRGVDKRITEIETRCRLSSWQSNSICEVIAESIEEAFSGNDAYPDGHKNKGDYLYCEFKCQILGA